MSEMNASGRIHSFESFALVDGPGVRAVIFMSGCALRCKFCHNPDTWAATKDTKVMTPQQAFDRVIRYRPYWKNNGGVTVSGGEPLLQMDFVIELFKLLKHEGVNTCIDTSGYPFLIGDDAWKEKFDTLMSLTDLVMLDLKQFDCAQHVELTGKPNEGILQMARYLSDTGKPMWIRHVLVPGITDDEQDLQNLRDFIRSLKTVERVELLPYHTMGMAKWEKLGIPYPLRGVPMPTSKEVQRGKALMGIEPKA